MSDGFIPGEESRYPLNMRLSGSENRYKNFGEGRNLLHHSGFAACFIHIVA